MFRCSFSTVPGWKGRSRTVADSAAVPAPIQVGAAYPHQQTAAAVAGRKASLTEAQFTLARGKNLSQRNALESVRGSNHPVWRGLRPILQFQAGFTGSCAK